MNHLQSRRYDMIQRVDVFLSEHADRFHVPGKAQELLSELASVRRDLKRLSPEQVHHVRSSQLITIDKKASLKRMRELLALISETSRWIARTIPRFDERFPNSDGKSVTALLHTARLFAEQAAPHKEEFCRYAIPEDFIVELNTLIQNVEKSLWDRAALRNERKAVTAEIDATIRKGLSVVAELNIIAGNILRNEPHIMREWNSARHVKRAPRKKAAAGGGSAAG